MSHLQICTRALSCTNHPHQANGADNHNGNSDCSGDVFVCFDHRCTGESCVEQGSIHMSERKRGEHSGVGVSVGDSDMNRNLGVVGVPRHGVRDDDENTYNTSRVVGKISEEHSDTSKNSGVNGEGNGEKWIGMCMSEDTAGMEYDSMSASSDSEALQSVLKELRNEQERLEEELNKEQTEREVHILLTVKDD